MQRQQAVDCQQDEVVVPQGIGWGTLKVFVRGEWTRRISEEY
jgi:hypothetical protein